MKIIKIETCLLLLLFPLLMAHGQDVLTQHNDNGRTGQNLNETILTPSNVNTSTFGKLFSMSVDGYIYAQPLYVSGVSIGGVSHNVVYVATEGDSVYAFDADTGVQLWHASLIDTAHGATSGETTGNIPNDLDSNCTDLIPQVGITSTPVIASSTGPMYVEAKSRESNGTYIHRLHMISITTGAEISPGPTVVTATVPGTSDGGTTITFDALRQLNRPGLLLVNLNGTETVYLGYASHCDQTPYHGWLFAYNASTLARTAVFITTPNGQGLGGIWMSGAGIAADSSGDIFTSTGNGNYDATDVGDSILKLTLSGSTLSLADYFTPFNQGILQCFDLDLASGGVLLLPDQPGAYPHELILAAKGGETLGNGACPPTGATSLGGIIFVVNRDKMTTNNSHYCSSSCNNTDPEIVQEIQNAGNLQWLWAMPAYWNNTVYFWGSSNDVLKAYTLTNGLLGISPSSSSTIISGFPGATPSISANGNTNGIVWAIETDNYGPPRQSVAGPAILRAFEATNVANELYDSSQMGSRDQAGNAVKFAVPTIAYGKVYIGTQGQLNVYGLLGSSPGQVATPTFNPAAGIYSSTQSVTISDATAGATIYYTTNGTTPTTSSTKYTGPITVSSTTTIEAMATASGMTNSQIASATYTIQPVGTAPSYGSGFTSAGLTLNNGATISGTRLRLTDGGRSEARSAFFSTPVNVQSFTNAFTFQDTSASADGLCFVIEASGPTALGGGGGALGYAGTTGALSTNSLCVDFDLYNASTATEISNTGLFTNGASPANGAGSAAGSLSFQSGDVMSVQMSYNGTTLTLQITDTVTNATYSTNFTVNIPTVVGGNTAYVGFTGATGYYTAIQDILTWTYTPGTVQAATPTITPGSGTESSPVTVTLTDTTSGATITYTTDGSTPVPGTHGTAISSGGSFSLSFTSTATVEAIASASGFTNSAIATATYTTQSGGGTPSYGSGFTSSGLTLNNGATISGTRLRLTDGGRSEARSAFFSTPVNVQSFTNAFTFQDTSASADGLCFVIEASGPTALGGRGGSLGYAGATGALSTNSLCVDFDLYNASTATEISNTGLFTNGASPANGAGSAAGSLSFQSGDVMSVQMSYNGTTLTLQITDTVTNATYSTNFTVNIPTVVGGNTAYVGFTGGTGYYTAIQDILTWTYTPTGGTPVAPTITTQPSNQTVTVGQTATFTVVASGTPTPSYQWLQNTGSGFTNISGATSASYTTPATTSGNNGTTFEVKVSNSQGSVTSNTATLTVTSSGTSPNYGSGFTSAGLTFNGGAIISGTRLRVTDGGMSEARSAFFSTPVNVQSFTNAFTFQDTSASADGLCFVIEASGPTALGGRGGSLGYAGATGALSTNSLCVDFDLYNASTATEISNTGLFTNGASPANGAGSAAGSLSFQSGDVMSVQMSYNGTTLTLQITDTVTNATYSTNFTVNIPTVVGGNTAYVGFTGATGYYTAIQDILTWTYTH